MLCPKCLGEGYQPNGSICEECRGAKEIPQARCPNAVLADSEPWTQEAFQAYSMFKNHQLLPVSGGLYEQTSYFVGVLNFCEGISAALERRREEHNEQIKSMGNKKPKTGGR